MNVSCKIPEEIQKMRIAGQLAARVLTMIEPHVKVGVTTQFLNELCHNYIVQNQKAVPASLHYKGFPKSICTSVNDVVCHGIPNDKPLKEGDIINIDVTVLKDGYHGDVSRMFFVGTPSKLAQRLVEVSRECLDLAIQIVKSGTTLGDIGYVIQTHAEQAGFSVVRDYCGHGIGKLFHEDPQVLHYGKKGTGLVLKPGMTITIEPMVNAKGHEVVRLSDGWTVITKDHSLSAQWEHTLLVTEDGREVLTLESEDLPS